MVPTRLTLGEMSYGIFGPGLEQVEEGMGLSFSKLAGFFTTRLFVSKERFPLSQNITDC